MNLIEMLGNHLKGDVLSQASKFLGESESNTSAAFTQAIPGVLGSLIQKGSSESGAGALLDLIKGDNFNGGVFDNLSGLFGGGSGTNSFLNSGSSLLNILMGNRTQGFVDLIVNATGLGKGSAGTIIKFAAPMLLNMIGKNVMSKGLGVSGLMDMLKGQSAHVQKSSSKEISDFFGFADFGESKKTASASASTRTHSSPDPEPSGGGWMKWLLGGLLALFILGYFGFKTGCGALDNAADTVADTTTGAVEKTAEVAGDAAGAVGDAAGAVGGAVGDAAGAVGGAVSSIAGATLDAAKSALKGVKFAAGSIGEGMSNFLAEGKFEAGKRFRFNNLTFATGSANITPATRVEVDNLAKVMQAYSGLQITVEGHTDNTGDEKVNLDLSQKRALAVKSYLTTKGINPNRVNVNGFGSAQPTASNDTAEGKAANRRIEVVLNSNDYK